MKRMPDGREPLACRGQIGGIEVHADQEPAMPDPPEKLDGMPGPADRTIDGDLPRLRIEGGQHFVQKNGTMLSRGCAAQAATHGAGLRGQGSTAASDARLVPVSAYSMAFLGNSEVGAGLGPRSPPDTLLERSAFLPADAFAAR